MTFTNLKKIKMNNRSLELREGLEKGDLARLVHDEIHIDEFRSKLGKDEDVCVVSFKVTGKDPALDLVSFVEKGYDWVLDADISSGELDDGDYIVFVEIERNPGMAKDIMEMVKDIMNLTLQDITDWRFQYHTDTTDHELTEENLDKLVPDSPEEYQSRHGKTDIDAIKTAAGLSVDTKAPVNDYTESLRVAAGIK